MEANEGGSGLGVKYLARVVVDVGDEEGIGVSISGLSERGG